MQAARSVAPWERPVIRNVSLSCFRAGVVQGGFGKCVFSEGEWRRACMASLLLHLSSEAAVVTRCEGLMFSTLEFTPVVVVLWVLLV